MTHKKCSIDVIPPRSTYEGAKINLSEFPPPSTSLKSFLDNDSDANFRKLIHNVLTVSSLMLKIRERFAAYIGLTAPQYSILVSIGESNLATISLLAQQHHVSTSFITVEVGKLERLGYVKRSINIADRRSAMLSLTKEGMALIIDVAEYRRLGNDLTFNSFSFEEAKIFSAHMEQLVKDAQEALHTLDAPHWKNS